jgi:hypothetical protein
MCVASPASKTVVMRGLDLRIHPSSKERFTKKMDCRVKPGNDALVLNRSRQ